jgi:hypothetical protein
MLAQRVFPHKELQKKSSTDLKKMLINANHDWENVETHFKQGFCIFKSESEIKTDLNIPIFSQDRDYINVHLKQIEG